MKNAQAPVMIGRPRTFNREAALDTALELFWQHGYEGVSIAALTRAFGIAPPSLYAAFGSKAELYREALDRYVSLTAGDEDLDELSAYDAIASILRRGAVLISRDDRPRGCMISSGMLACGPDYAGLANDVRQMRLDMLHDFERRIRADVASDRLPACVDAAALARFYATVAQGLSVQARDGATTEELLAVVSQALAGWPKGAWADDTVNPRSRRRQARMRQSRHGASP